MASNIVDVKRGSQKVLCNGSALLAWVHFVLRQLPEALRRRSHGGGTLSNVRAMDGRDPFASSGPTVEIPNVVLRSPLLCTKEKAILWLLRLHLDESGWAVVSPEQLASECAMGPRQVRRWMKRLRSLGLVESDPRGRAHRVVEPLSDWLTQPIRLEPTENEGPQQAELDRRRAEIAAKGRVRVSMATDVGPTAFPNWDGITHPRRLLSVGAEIAVAEALRNLGWQVAYRGSQAGVGYDLEATRQSTVSRVEVKASARLPNVILLSSVEWDAACRYGDEYVLAVVDEYGTPLQSVWFVQHPSRISLTSRIKREVLRSHAFRAANLLAVMLGL